MDILYGTCYIIARMFSFGIILIFLFAPLTYGENIHFSETCVINSDDVRRLCATVSDPRDEEFNQLRALAISGWTFFGVLFVFTLVIAVKEGRIICEDSHSEEDFTKERKQSETRKDQVYDVLKYDQQESKVEESYDDLQLEKGNNADKVYENSQVYENSSL